MPAEICIYLCRCISMLCPGIRKWQIRSLGTICSQKVRESVPMHNYCHSENQNWRKEPPRNLQFFHENNTINSFEFPEIPKSGGSFFFHFDWFDWYGNFISINRRLKLQDQNICIRKTMKRDIRIIQKVTLSSPSLLACFHPLSPLSVCPQSNEILFKSQYEMLKLSIECTRFESNYNSCTGRSSENICNTSGGAQEKRKDRMKLSLPPKLVEKLVCVPVISFCKIFIPVKDAWCPIISKLAVLAH
jgi:hypothetical protein